MLDKLLTLVHRRLVPIVQDINSTNWMVLTGCLCGALTLVLLYAIVLLQKPIGLDIWLAWLAFLSSWIGFGVRQFKHKRQTFMKGGSQDDTNGSGLPPYNPGGGDSVRQPPE